MGGRGTFASGRNVAYTYSTIGEIGGIKVLQGMGGKHGLPEEAHSSRAYIALNHDKSVRQIRFYHPNLTSKTDIEFSVHQGKLSLHAHDYINGKRQGARSLTKREYEEYNKFFGGKK